MATGTVEDVFETVRALLGDTDIPGGDVMDDEEQRVPFATAWDELVSMMAADQIPAAKRTYYHFLSSYTSVLFPEQAGINDFDSLVGLYERAAPTSFAISAIAAGAENAIQITTTAPHGYTGTPIIFVSDVLNTDGIAANGRWFATVIDATNLLLRGSIFTGSYTAGGTVSTSTEEFTPVNRTELLSQRTPDTKLLEYSWQEDAFQFVGATADVQLRIAYLSDGTAPASGSLVYDGIKNALAHRTAAILAFKHGRGQDDGPRLDEEARGPARDGMGGFYFTFLQRKVREMQKDPLQRPVRPPDHLSEVYSVW